MEDQIDAIWREISVMLTTYGLDVVGGIVILLVGITAAGWVQNMVERGLGRTRKIDDMLRGFFGSLAKYAVLAITIIAVLNQFGVETTSLIAVLGAAGLAIGLAMQGTLSNVAAGVMLLIFRPFKVGQYVQVGGHAGTIKGLSLFVTEMATPDNVQIIVPNSQVWGSAVINYSYHATRRLDLVLGIAYEDDVDKAKAAILDTVKADERVHAEPEPMAEIANLGESSVDFTIRVWCDNADYWPLKWDMTRALKQRMDAEGITIPFPQRTVHTVAAD